MFRFSIRELFLATLVVAMGAAWFTERRGHDAVKEELAEANLEMTLSRAFHEAERKGIERALEVQGIELCPASCFGPATIKKREK